MVNDIPYFGNGFSNHADDVFLCNNFIPINESCLFCDEFLYLGRDTFVVGSVGKEFHSTFLEEFNFGGHLRKGESAKSVNEAANEGEGDENTENARAQMKAELQEADDGIDEVCDEPCDEEGHENALEIVDKENDANDACKDE